MATLKPKNALAKKLLEVLAKLGVRAHAGFFNGEECCVGVKIYLPEDGVKLGIDLRAWGDLSDWGRIDSDQQGLQQYVVFRDALVEEVEEVEE